MLFLISDTSGKQGSIALARSDSIDRVDMIDSVPLAGGTFSAQLIPQVAGLLGKHGFLKTDLDAFIVVSGPGSFTGLRVGLAAIKALAEVLHRPIVPVSLLEVVARASGVRGRVLAALEAGRGEIFAGEYEVTGEARVVGEFLWSRQEFLSAAKNSVVATPDESLAQEARDTGASVASLGDIGKMIAQIGRQKVETGHVVAPEQLDANYIRRSDAEIFAKTGSGPLGS